MTPPMRPDWKLREKISDILTEDQKRLAIVEVELAALRAENERLREREVICDWCGSTLDQAQRADLIGVVCLKDAEKCEDDRDRLRGQLDGISKLCDEAEAEENPPTRSVEIWRLRQALAAARREAKP